MRPDWTVMPFDRFAVLQRGRDLTKAEFRAGEVPVAGSNGLIGFHDTAYVPAPGVTVGRSGSVGKVSIYRCPFWAHNTCLYVRDFCGNDEEFAYYLLLHLDVGRYKSGASVPTLDRNTFRSLPISVPAIPEQRQIAAVLSAVQRAIERQERLIALTAELKKALMHKLFTEGTRGEALKGTQIGPVPESWTVEPLDQFAESFQYGTSVKCGYDVKGPPVLRIPNVVGGHMDVGDLKFGVPKRNEIESVRLRRGDLLFVRTNGVRENAGRCSMYRGELGESCYFASYLIRVRLSDGLMPEFLEEYTRTEIGVKLLAGRSIRTADGKFNINSGTLQTLLVPKPDVDEQKLIAESLGLLDRKARVHVASKAAIDRLFRTLLHDLMTARIRVNDLDLSALDETARAAVGAM